MLETGDRRQTDIKEGDGRQIQGCGERGRVDGKRKAGEDKDGNGRFPAKEMKRKRFVPHLLTTK